MREGKGEKGFRGIPLIILFMLLSIFCQPSDNPQKIITKCVDAIIAGSFDKAYGYFSFKDKNTKSLSEFVQELALNQADSGIIALTADRIDYVIVDIATSNDSARATLKITIPAIMSRRLSYLFADVYKETKIDYLIDSKKNHIYILALEGQVRLIKEMEGWRIYGNWQKIRDREEKEAQMILEYIKSYIKIIESIKICEYQDTRKIFLEGMVKNTGGKTLEDVELMITCYNKNEKPCYILSEHPVNANEKPLRPKKIRKFKIDLSAAPADWAKNVEIKIVNCKFSD